jgi:hypothetical protein
MNLVNLISIVETDHHFTFASGFVSFIHSLLPSCHLEVVDVVAVRVVVAILLLLPRIN